MAEDKPIVSPTVLLHAVIVAREKVARSQREIEEAMRFLEELEAAVRTSLAPAPLTAEDD